MSYIDSFRHQIVGHFAGLPVYWPLEDIPEPPMPDWDADFTCTTGQLVIGGGGGEHPGVVLRLPEAAVWLFARASEDFDLTDLATPDEGLKADGDILHFAGWIKGDRRDFEKRCRSSALYNPYWPSCGLSLAEWLAAGLGEFVYYSLPQLAPEAVARLKPRHVETDHVRFSNIGLIPPGMPVYANGGAAFTAALARR